MNTYTLFETLTDYTSVNEKSLHTDNCTIIADVDNFHKDWKTISYMWTRYTILDYQKYTIWDECPYYANQSFSLSDFIEEGDYEYFILVDKQKEYENNIK